MELELQVDVFPSDPIAVTMYNSAFGTGDHDMEATFPSHSSEAETLAGGHGPVEVEKSRGWGGGGYIFTCTVYTMND